MRQPSRQERQLMHTETAQFKKCLFQGINDEATDNLRKGRKRKKDKEKRKELEQKKAKSRTSKDGNKKREERANQTKRK